MSTEIQTNYWILSNELQKVSKWYHAKQWNCFLLLLVSALNAMKLSTKHLFSRRSNTSFCSTDDGSSVRPVGCTFKTHFVIYYSARQNSTVITNVDSSERASCMRNAFQWWRWWNVGFIKEEIRYKTTVSTKKHQLSPCIKTYSSR